MEREETIEAWGLTEDLGFHPLACDVAGLYVKRRAITFASYRQLIAGSLAHFDTLAEGLGEQLPGDHAQRIFATLATSLKELGSKARTFLRIAVLCP